MYSIYAVEFAPKLTMCYAKLVPNISAQCIEHVLHMSHMCTTSALNLRLLVEQGG